jgi:membrane dipeptidase
MHENAGLGDRASAALEQSIVWDAHSCLPMRPDADLSQLARHKAAGLDYVSISVGVDMTPFDQIIRTLAHFRSQIRQRSDLYELACTIEDIKNAKDSGKLALSFDLEGSLPLLGDPAMVHFYHDLGVRQIHLAYNRNNAAAAGCHGDDVPLTRLGRVLVAEINHAGIIMDCSHTGYRSSMGIMEASIRPVVFSHSNPRSLIDHARNINDDQIRACAQTGGVVGICGIGLLLGGAAPNMMATHIDYIAQLVGSAHVGIGLDFLFAPEIDDMPEELDRDYWWPSSAGYGAEDDPIAQVKPEQLGEIREALRARGYSAADVANIFGGNFLRVAEATWK